MGMLTSARVEIAAPAAEVFAWLIEPAKLTAWLGAPGAMPEDTSQLRTGWTGTSQSPLLGSVTLEIRVYDPPERLEHRTVHAGGDAVTTYRLTEGEGVTTLICEGDTDGARPAGEAHAIADAALEGQPAQAQQALEASLLKLRSLVEAGAAR